MKCEPCVGNRSVKRTAIEGDNGVSLREDLGNRAEHRRLVPEVAQEVLTCVKRAALEPTQSDQESDRPSSPAQPSGLEVEADDRSRRTSDRCLTRELQDLSRLMTVHGPAGPISIAPPSTRAASVRTRSVVVRLPCSLGDQSCLPSPLTISRKRSSRFNRLSALVIGHGLLGYCPSPT